MASNSEITTRLLEEIAAIAEEKGDDSMVEWLTSDSLHDEVSATIETIRDQAYSDGKFDAWLEPKE